MLGLWPTGFFDELDDILPDVFSDARSGCGTTRNFNVMSDELHTWNDPEIEARLVAWALGEASAFEAAELARIVETRPELGVFKRRIEAVHGLVREASRPEGSAALRLAPERRLKVAALLGVEAGPERKVAAFVEKPKRATRWLPLAAACLIVALIAGLMFPSVSAVKESSRKTSSQMEAQARFAEAQIAAQEEASSAASAPEEGPVYSVPVPSSATPPPQMDLAAIQSDYRSGEVKNSRMFANTDELESERRRSGDAPIADSSGGAPASRPRGEGAAGTSGDEGVAATAGLAVGATRSASKGSMDGFTLQLPAKEPVEFAGGIDYGSPIQTPTRDIPLVGDVPATGYLYKNRTDWKLPASSGVRSGSQTMSDADVDKLLFFFGAGEAVLPANQEPSNKKAETVKKDFVEAEDFYELGRYDLAFKRYEQILQADPYNVAARRGQEKVNEARSNYTASARDETRSRGIWQVDSQWARPVRRARPVPGAKEGGAGSAKDSEVAETRERVERMARDLEQLSNQMNVSDPSAQPAGTEDVQAAYANTKAEYVAEKQKLEALSRLAKADHSEPAVGTKSGQHAVIEINREFHYPTVFEQPQQQRLATEIAAATQPFSTFSLHVSDVSFRLAQAALAKGELPEAERIRAEEFYNAFDYGDPAPSTGQEVAGRIEQCAHPLLQQRNLVRIAMKVAATGRGAGVPLRLTILLDTSGSMEREDRAESVRRAMDALAWLLGPKDSVTLIGFARTPRLLAEAVPGDEAAKLVELVKSTPSEGGTNLEEALKLAADKALKNKAEGAQNRIVLLTDGAANLGNADPEQLGAMIEKLRRQGIAFDACGVGAAGLNDEILEALTRKGDGRYYFLDRPEDADAGFARQLAGAFRPAAENVKVQVRFNPARVGKYRLIGFEKHRLAEEDFRNDKVDAAELAAEEAGVALYAVETLPEGEGELGEVFVRFRDAASGRMVERSWTMPYDAAARAFDQASRSMQLAAVAALLAEKLRGLPVELEALAPVVNRLRGHFAEDRRVGELVGMFERVREMKK